MNDHRYPLTYTITVHDPPLTADQVRAQNEGACDAVVIFSLIYPADGSFSSLLLSKDGRTGEELTDKELWKVWSMFARRLADSKTLDPARKAIAAIAFDDVREMILRVRDEERKRST